MANNRLNERQEKFCQEVMQGKTQRQAYYSAYPSSLKWKVETVDSKASIMANNGKVLARLEELRAEAAEQNKITRNDLIEQLKTIGFSDIDLDDIRPTDKIKAIEAMAKILGFDKADTENKENSNGILPDLLDYLKKTKNADKP